MGARGGETKVTIFLTLSNKLLICENVEEVDPTGHPHNPLPPRQSNGIKFLDVRERNFERRRRTLNLVSLICGGRYRERPRP